MDKKPVSIGKKQSGFARGILAAAIVAAIFAGGNVKTSRAAEAATGPVIDDWTHHRLMFSDPGSLADAVRHGRVNEWLRVTNDPRFALQRRKQQAALAGGARFEERWREVEAREREIEKQFHRERHHPRPQADSPPGTLSVAEAERILGIRAPAQEERPRRKHPAASGALQLDWSENMAASASGGTGIFPAKFSFSLTTANCSTAGTPDFVAYNTRGMGAVGPGGQATIIAYDNLYAGTGGCTGTVPSVYWAFNTGTSSTITTSPILSLDGKQLAFAQTNGTSAALVILKWASSTTETATNPDSLPTTPTSTYRSCTAPCMTTIAFGNGANDSASSPFYDYSGTDALYIGDDTGHLHKFTGVFSGTPAEVTSGWPVTVNSSSQPLSGPILDGASGNIFVGDYSTDFTTGATSAACGTVGCGVLHAVTTAGAVAGTSNRLDSQYGLVDSPLVDSNAKMVYAFAGADTSTSCSLGFGPCSGVYQFPTSFTSGSGTEAKLGAGLFYLLSGSFDNAYFTSANSASPTGHIYVVGGTGLANNTLYQVSISANVMSTTVVTGPELADNFLVGFTTQAGLGITEIANGAHDFIFLSVISDGFPSGCGGTGCVIGYDVASGTITTSTAPAFAVPETNGTSGIIIDNTVILAGAGASQIYFTPLGSQACTGGTGRCAIQLSQ